MNYYAICFTDFFLITLFVTLLLQMWNSILSWLIHTG